MVLAKGYYNLGKMNQAAGEDLFQAEKLARESYRIRVQLYQNDRRLVYRLLISKPLLKSYHYRDGQIDFLVTLICYLFISVHFFLQTFYYHKER